MTAQATTEKPRSDWHASRRAARERIDAEAARTASLWFQMRRIEAYLPVLYRQREEAARRLTEITDLIHDEEQAVREIRDTVV